MIRPYSHQIRQYRESHTGLINYNSTFHFPLFTLTPNSSLLTPHQAQYISPGSSNIITSCMKRMAFDKPSSPLMRPSSCSMDTGPS